MSGTVEGFYGPPWSHADRLAHLEFSAEAGFDTFVYAPKDDPHHRVRWRSLYPAAELRRLAELAATGRRLGVRFVYAISPGLSMGFADDAEHRALLAKAAQLAGAGVEEFALFFDDVPAELARPAERSRWPGPEGSGAAHGETCARFAAAFPGRPLLVCPTDYAGTSATPYRRGFARTSPPDTLVAWTGRDVVVGTVTREEIDQAARSYGRRVVLWDNFPVNDFAPSRLFLGPLTGRTTDLAGSALAGVLANPMELAAPSRIPLVSVASWAADPGGYDPEASAERALRLVAGAGAAPLAPFVRANSSWPPSAVQDKALARAAERALASWDAMTEAAASGTPHDPAATVHGGTSPTSDAGTTSGTPLLDGASPTSDVGTTSGTPLLDRTSATSDAGTTSGTPLLDRTDSGVATAGREALAEMTGRLEELARGCRAAAEPGWLITPLRPWLDAGAAMAEAGLAAARLLAAPTEARRREARAALTSAETHYADVLRSVVPPFARAVLDRTAPPGPAPAPDGSPCVPTGDRRTAGDEGPASHGSPIALVLTGNQRTAGDEVLAELVESLGYAVCPAGNPPAEPSGVDRTFVLAMRAALVVVTGQADPAATAAVARTPAPLVAWQGFVPLGLATTSAVLLSRDRLRVTDPADPLAAGLDGEVTVFRGRSRITVAGVGPDAHVVARPSDDDRAALFHYPRGSRLADGTTAAGPRTGVFLPEEGMAPWLLTAEARAILTAALRYGRPSR
ncbi:hypothetical protein Ade02nite_17890 [Paractinoplanes deccanensis]|uniref:GH84 domain-containing protein n=1 Tax=Paractinoplanes deccanensis TaxID=113561 RepID=A0ABQ3XZH2_9ACTN|nr:protein O-GlcNAcase [Actinoplanes deccanensis]GID73148.1 hypothetical protein Ade02nite_17890 [Actinoplanes deccanensis]